MTKQAKANGMIPLYWDNGATRHRGSVIFERKTRTIFDQQALDAIIEAGD